MQNILEYARLKEIKECDCYEKENHFKKLLSKIIAPSSWITYLIGLGFFYHATDLVFQIILLV